MLLDAIQQNLDSVWMSSRGEKVDYFSKRGIASDDCPHRTVRQGDQRLVRPFPDLLPIGVHPSGHVVFVYLDADPLRDEFRDFLQRHAPLLERLPGWTLRIVVPPHLAGVPDRLQKMAWGHLASPLSELLLTEARWYFDRRAAGLASLSEPADRRHFERCERGFATDRYTVLYRCWREDGSGCWRPPRRRLSDRRWSQGPARSSRWFYRTPTAIWRRRRVSPEGLSPAIQSRKVTLAVTLRN
jgi:hypothetical protein